MKDEKQVSSFILVANFGRPFAASGRATLGLPETTFIGFAISWNRMDSAR
jgi:hypothetical protein